MNVSHSATRVALVATWLLMAAAPVASAPRPYLILRVPDSASAGSLYLGSQGPSRVGRYVLPDPTNKGPACTFSTDLTFGIGVDGAGTLWVPQHTINEVTTYKKDSCQPTTFTLHEPNGNPSDIAFATNGTVYVLDTIGTNKSPGLVSVYASGATTPATTLTDPSIQYGEGIAVDASGDVFVSYSNTSGASAIVVFPGGRMPGTVLPLTGLTSVAGLELDAHQNLIAVDFDKGIDVFAPPYRGAPTSSFATRGASRSAKLDASGATLYVSDLTTRTVDVYAYPSGAYKYSITTDTHDAIGVAVDRSLKD